MIRLITILYLTIISVTISFAQVTSEEILIKNNEVELPGTLTFIKENTPLIIWVHGSGGVDRNGNQPQYIKQFKEAVNQQNIAFFSYDKRTSNKKNAAILKKGVLFNHFVSDAKAVINHFKASNRFSKIILVGHSQGSLTAMLASENADKFISIAGAGETIDYTLTRQITNQNAFLGEATKSHLEELKKTGTIKNVNPMLLSLFSKPNIPFLNSWIKLNPTEEIKKVTIPTLIINGNKDLQVFEKDAQLLHQAKPNATLAIIPNMNHLLKDIQKDENNLISYTTPNFPISKKLIETVVSFIKK